MSIRNMLRMAIMGMLFMTLTACGSNIFESVGLFSSSPTSANTKTTIAIVNQNPDSLWNYQLGRDYASAGRYELAKEHYLLAIASARSPELVNALSAELHSIDLMLQSLR